MSITKKQIVESELRGLAQKLMDSNDIKGWSVTTNEYGKLVMVVDINPNTQDKISTERM